MKKNTISEKERKQYILATTLAEEKKNTIGIVGLCLGIFFPIVGLILGIISLAKGEKTPAIGICAIVISSILLLVVFSNIMAMMG